jgi:ribonuclease HI
MSPARPHFLLYSEAALEPSRGAAAGRWRFTLRDEAGRDWLHADDSEDEATAERLELLAVVRGLEALDQPSRVTLATPSRSLARGLAFGLAQWRESDWHWERFGRMTPVKNSDLWQRLDRLLAIHSVECRANRLEKADDLAPPPAPANPPPSTRRLRGAGGRMLRIDGPEGPHQRGVSSGPARAAPRWSSERPATAGGRWSRLRAALEEVLARLVTPWGLLRRAAGPEEGASRRR